MFLVDRKDLDSQTLGEFNKFELDSVGRTFYTKSYSNKWMILHRN